MEKLLKTTQYPKESYFKSETIALLNQITKGWEDGDLQNTKDKTVDLVNNSLKIAIEISDVFRKDNSNSSFKQIREQFKRAARHANGKFKNYPRFKTISLIRTNLPDCKDLIEYIFVGVIDAKRIKDGYAKITWKDKFLSPKFTSIGCYIFYDINGKRPWFFLNNQISIRQRMITINDVKKIIPANITKNLKELKLQPSLPIIHNKIK